jgi:hypothetical protein
MRLVRWSVSLFGTVAILAALFAGATIWLLVTDPVTVAETVNQGDVSPFMQQLAGVLFTALKDLLKYLSHSARSRNLVNSIPSMYLNGVTPVL